MKTSEIINDPAPKELFRGDIMTQAILREEQQKRECADESEGEADGRE